MEQKLILHGFSLLSLATYSLRFQFLVLQNLSFIGLRVPQITIEEIQDFLSQVDFENMVREYAEGLHDNDPIPETDPYVEFEIPCAGYDCALSPQREDACRPEYRTERDGKVYCKIRFNLNKLVKEGKTEFAHPTPDPNLVTPEEAKMFHDWYLKFTKYIESNKNTQEV